MGAALLSPACAPPAPEPTDGTSKTPSLQAPTLSLEDIIRATDTRKTEPALLEALKSSDPEHRRTALVRARALSPLPNESVQDALRDPVPAVRAAAAALLAVNADVGPGPRPLLLALAAETNAAARAAELRALGRFEGPELVPAWSAALDHSDPTTVEAACQGLARSRAPAKQLEQPALAKQLESPEPPVRRACAFALAVLPVPADLAAQHSIGLDLQHALANPDPELRLFALQALQRYPLADRVPVDAATLDADWRVAAQAFKTLAAHDGGAGSRYVATLRRFAEAVLADPKLLDGPGLRVWESALRAAAPFADSAESLAEAQRWLARLQQHWETVPSPRLAAAHCEIAAWVDRGLRWPRALRSCGDGQAPMQQILMHEASIVASQPSDPALRANYLAKMLQRSGTDAREPVLRQYSRVRHPSLLAPAAHLLRTGSPSDVGRAARALVHLSPAFPRHARSAATRDALQRDTLEAFKRLGETGSVPTLLALLDMILAYDLAGLEAVVSPLAMHASPDVSGRARTFLESVGSPIGSQKESPTISSVNLASGTKYLRLHTTAGDILLELQADRAPTSVARLLAATSIGALRDSILIPGATPPEVRLGDPFASMPPGSDTWIRREPNDAPFERGSVGLVQAGRHSSALSLFITLSRRPDLDGGPTHLGRVTQGMEVLEAAHVGERVLSIETR